MTERPRRLEWDTWLADCNPSLWRMRVESSAGSRPEGPIRSTIPVPADREIRLAIARTFGRGTYRVVPQLRNSKSRGIEQERLGGSTVRACTVVVGDDECEAVAKEKANIAATAAAAPAVARTRIVDDPGVIEADRAARIAEARRKQAEAEAAIRRAERADGAGDVAALRTMLAQQPKGDGGAAAILAPVLAMMQQSMQQQQALLLSLLQSSQAREQRAIELLQQRETQTTADRLPELETIERTLSMVGRVRELVARDDGGARSGGDAEPAWVGAVVDILKPHVGTVVGRLVGAPPQAAPSPAAALPMPEAAAEAPAAARVLAFVQRALTEAVNGSEPTAIADLILDDVPLLPLAVRMHLVAGRGVDALLAARGYLPADRQPDIDALLANQDARTWIDALADAIRTADDIDGEDVAHG